MTIALTEEGEKPVRNRKAMQIHNVTAAVFRWD